MRAETDSDGSIVELEGGQADSAQDSGSGQGRKQVGETNTHASNAADGQKLP